MYAGSRKGSKEHGQQGSVQDQHNQLHPGAIYGAGWEALGGLKDTIAQLKEMVLLPLVYPQLFKELGITPPRCELLTLSSAENPTWCRVAVCKILGPGASVESYGRQSLPVESL